MPEPPRAVIFDIGGVLLDWNPRHLYRELFDDEQEMERFLAEVCTMQWHSAHDLGVPYEVTCGQLAARHPQYAEMIWAWARRTEDMIGGAIGGTVEILGTLIADGVRCFALTNMEADTYPRRLARWEFMRWFDGTVVSAHEGIAKPDPEIFHRLLDRYGLDAPATAFIDDAPANVAAADRLGLRAHRFRSPDELAAWLRTEGLLRGDGHRDQPVGDWRDDGR